jgi:hypothetical protein
MCWSSRLFAFAIDMMDVIRDYASLIHGGVFVYYYGYMRALMLRDDDDDDLCFLLFSSFFIYYSIYSIPI